MNDKLVYMFKAYCPDGTAELIEGRAAKPELLYNNFDGLMDWKEFDKLDDNISVTEVLNIAKDIYKDKYIKIEIINTKTNKVIEQKIFK